jgi:hypothetical protein
MVKSLRVQNDTSVSGQQQPMVPVLRGRRLGAPKIGRHADYGRPGPLAAVRKLVYYAVVVTIAICGIAGAWRLSHLSAFHSSRAVVKASEISSRSIAPVARAADITATSAEILWNTERPLSSQVEYGVSSDYGSLSAFTASAVTAHAVTLTGLEPGTTYHYAGLSTDDNGQVIRSEDLTFATPNSAGTQVAGPARATEIKATSVTITWTTDKPSASQVEYGTTAAHGLLSVFNPSIVTAHSVILTGLTPGTGYDAVAMSTDSAGQVGRSANFTFSTTGTAGAPTISFVSVGDITTNSATVSWTTDKPAMSQVSYGLKATYGSLSAFNASPVTTHSIILTALTPGTKYNLAALSANSMGQVGTSANATFTTVAAPPLIRDVRTSAITENSATITWTTDQPSTSRVEFGNGNGAVSHSAPDAALVLSHSVTLRGLKRGATYRSAVISTNAAGMQNSSPQLTFTTSDGLQRY